VGATLRNTGLFGSFRLLTARWRLRGGSFYGQFSHCDFSFGGDYRHDIHHSGWDRLQGNSADAEAIKRRCGRNSSVRWQFLKANG
jgi:hypothetical protein